MKTQNLDIKDSINPSTHFQTYFMLFKAVLPVNLPISIISCTEISIPEVQASKYSS